MPPDAALTSPLQASPAAVPLQQGPGGGAGSARGHAGAPVSSPRVPSLHTPSRRVPTPGAVLELLKPITWFPPMWAYACGMVSSGAPLGARFWAIFGGIVLAGPVLCGTSQAINDWFDRHVDAINEPRRVIPSGRMPGRWGLGVAVTGSALSLALAALLGPWVLAAATLGLALAWAYSAPPFRLKRDGWAGPGAVALAYEGLPWFTAAAAALGTLPDGRIVALAALYALGAHGIMTLNDFKAVEGDRALGLRSLPVRYGVDTAARLACAVMALPQIAVAALLLGWGHPVHAALLGALLVAQGACMARLLRAPRERAPWYNATGTGLYVSGMMVAALALRAGGAS